MGHADGHRESVYRGGPETPGRRRNGVFDPNRSWFESSRAIARIALIHLNAALRSGAATFER
jgi:hypothetical protein